MNAAALLPPKPGETRVALLPPGWTFTLQQGQAREPARLLGKQVEPGAKSLAMVRRMVTRGSGAR